MDRSRRPLLLAALLALAVIAGIAWWLLRPVPWNDPETPPPAFARARALFESGDLDRAAETLARALRRVRAPDWEPSFRILGAARLLDGDRAEEALALVRRPFPESSPLVFHASLLRARGLLAAGRAEEAARAAREAADAEGFPAREEAERIAARALEVSGRAGDGVERLDRSGLASLRLEAARLAFRSGDAERGRRIAAEIALAPEPGETAERALELLRAEVADPARRLEGRRREEVAAVARRWIDARRAARALDLLRATRPTAAGARDLPAEEALVEALGLHQVGRHAESAPFLARAEEGTPPIKDGAAYLRARLALATGRPAAWKAGLEALARRPGRSEWKIQALRDLALLGEGAPSTTTLARYRRYRETAGGSADPTALLREFWAAWDLGRRDEADRALERILALDDAPAGVRAAALYWRGRRLESLRRGDEARRTVFLEITERFRNHYYGAVLERHLGRPSPTLPTAASEGPSPPAASGRRWLAAARALRRVGLHGPAAESFRAAIAEAESEAGRAIALEAAFAALDAGFPTEALGFAQAAAGNLDAAAPDALPRSLWRLLYPVPGAAVVAEAARRERLDPRFLAAVIREESAFNPVAVSSAGARGLMQLMPAVGSEWAGRLRMRDFTTDRLFEPEVNLRLGAAYLRALVDRFRFPEAALAAYNAGPTRADRWSVPGDAPEAFVERIPIPETRLYVKRIATSARFYRMIWPEDLKE